MEKTIILLTKSRKHGGYCTSGIDIEDGKWIRIISDGLGCSTDEIPSSQLTYDNGNEANILDIIKVHCTEYRPNYFQPENYVNDRNEIWEKLGRVTFSQVLQLHPFENKDDIYFDTSYSILGAHITQIPYQDRYSLILIKVDNPEVNVKTWESGRKNVTLSFSYNNNYYKYFRITDGSENSYLNYRDGNYIEEGSFGIVISLGELFTDLKHYKLIASSFLI